jgi:hypothetical protein
MVSDIFRLDKGTDRVATRREIPPASREAAAHHGILQESTEEYSRRAHGCDILTHKTPSAGVAMFKRGCTGFDCEWMDLRLQAERRLLNRQNLYLPTKQITNWPLHKRSRTRNAPL